MTEKTSIVGILIGEASSPEKARLIMEDGLRCPYAVTYAISGNTIVGIFSVPIGHEWWLEWVEKDPKGTIGLEHAELFLSRKSRAQSPWAREDVKPVLEGAPCGADCLRCARYSNECRGCPAATFYIAP